MKKPPPPETQFKPGHPKVGGRPKGIRNKFSNAFVADVAAKWEEKKVEIFNMMIAEFPEIFFKVCASLVPQKFEIDDQRDPESELSDERVDELIRAVDERISRELGGATGGTGTPDGGEDQAKVRH